MSYVFDVLQDKETDMEHFLKQYTESVEPTMSYKSKLTTLAGVTDIKNTIISIGGTIAFIIGIIGVLNFINTILTSILICRRELAILQSVGNHLDGHGGEGHRPSRWTYHLRILQRN